MEAKDVMTPDPACCTPDTMLEQVARKMVENDCGEIPVVDNMATMLPVGVITDRDITCRTVAKGLNPLVMTAADCMTTPCVTVTPETSLDECCRIMEENQRTLLRRSGLSELHSDVRVTILQCQRERGLSGVVGNAHICTGGD